MANCHKTLVKNRASFDSITVWSNIEWAKYRCAALMIVYHLAKVRAGVVYVFVCLHVFCAAVTIRIYRGKARAVKRTTTKPPIRHSDWILKLHCALNILITNYTRLWEKLIDLKRFSEIWLARNLFSEALQCRRWSENRGTRVFEFALGLLWPYLASRCLLDILWIIVSCHQLAVQKKALALRKTCIWIEQSDFPTPEDFSTLSQLEKIRRFFCV